MGKWAIINWAIFNSYFDITRGYGIWQPTYCFGAAPKSFIVLGLFVRIWRSPRKGCATWCSCDGEKLLMGSNCEAAIFWKAGFGTNQVLKTVDMGRKIECLVFSFRDLFYVNPEKHNDDLLGLHIRCGALYIVFPSQTRTPGDGIPCSIPSSVGFYPFVLQ